VPNGATSRIDSSFRASLSRLTPTTKQITPAFSVGVGVWRQEGVGGGKCAGVKFYPRAAIPGGGEWHGASFAGWHHSAGRVGGKCTDDNKYHPED